MAQNSPIPLEPLDEATMRRLAKEPAGKLIKWENGVPVPVYIPPINKQAIEHSIVAHLSLPYRGDQTTRTDPDTGEVIEELTVDPHYVGLRNLDVMTGRLVEKAVAGSLNATEMVMDRLIGKPKQQVESVNVQVSYQEFLDSLPDPEPEPGLVVDIYPTSVPGPPTLRWDSTPQSPADDDEDPDDDAFWDSLE